MPRSTVRRNLRQRTVSEPTLALSTSEEETGHRPSLRVLVSPSGRNVASPAAAPSANPIRVSIAPVHAAQIVGATSTAKPRRGFEPWQVAVTVLYLIAAAAALAVFRPTWTYPSPSTSSVLTPPPAQPPVQVRPQPPSERMAHAAALDLVEGSLRAVRGPPPERATAASSSSFASPWLLDAWAADAADTGAAALPPVSGAAQPRSAAPAPPLPASLGLSLPAVPANVGLTLPPLPLADEEEELGAADADSPPESVHTCSYPMLDFSAPIVTGHSSAATADAGSSSSSSSGAAHTSISLAYAPWRVRWPTFLLRDHALWWEQYKVRRHSRARCPWEGRRKVQLPHTRLCLHLPPPSGRPVAQRGRLPLVAGLAVLLRRAAPGRPRRAVGERHAPGVARARLRPARPHGAAALHRLHAARRRRRRALLGRHPRRLVLPALGPEHAAQARAGTCSAPSPAT